MGHPPPSATGRATVLVIVLWLASATAFAGDPATPTTVPDPRAEAYSVTRTGPGGALVRLSGETVGEYVVDRGNKPFLWRLVGPTGKSMTRSFPMADVAGEQTDHVHQRGLSFGHERVGGFNVWVEEATYRDDPAFSEKVGTIGAIRHRGYRTLTGGSTAVIHARNDILDAGNRPRLAQECRMTFSFGPSARMLDVDLDLVAAYGPVALSDTKDAGVYIRVPDSMTVDRGLGGTIISSEGHRDADAWSRKAAWVDYHGPVEGEHVGVAILNHPTSFRHPTPWHVRTYGLFCANPFGMRHRNADPGSGAVSLANGERISLRHRFIFHVGDERQGAIAEAYEAYATETPASLAHDGDRPSGR